MSNPLHCPALLGDWNEPMPCGHRRQYGTLGDVFPAHCLACENSQLRDKLRETKQYLRSANKGAEDTEYGSLLIRGCSDRS